MKYEARLELETKRMQLQKELEEWAVSSGVLKTGEQLVFSLRIEKTPTVVVDNTTAEDCLDMAPAEFFSADRINGLGHNHYVGNRISARIRKLNIPTLRQFLVEYPTYESLSRMKGLGTVSIRAMQKLLQMEGVVRY